MPFEKQVKADYLSVNVYVDEQSKQGTFEIGAIAVMHKNVMYSFRELVHPFRSEKGLKFHCYDDLVANQGETHRLKEILFSWLSIKNKDGFVMCRLFSGKTEHDAWRKLIDWIRNTHKPSYDQPVNIMHDMYDFSNKEGGAGKLIKNLDSNIFRVQSVPKIKSHNASPQTSAYMIGAIDYLLYFNMFRKLYEE